MRRYNLWCRKIMSILLVCTILISTVTWSVKAAEVRVTSDVFDQMRQNYVDYLTGQNDLYTVEEALNNPYMSEKIDDMDAEVADLIATMNTGSNRTSIWSDLDRIINNGEVWPLGAKDKRSDDTKTTYYRLEKLALAYETVGSQYYHDQNTRDLVINAFNWLYDNDWYSDTNNVQEGGNWWDWTIGLPNSFLNSVMIFHDTLSPQELQNYIDSVNNFSHDFSSTGANLMWQIHKFVLVEILEKDSNQIHGLINRLSDMFQYVEDHDGFYEDGSFIQHGNVSNTGNYGISLISFLSAMMIYTQDTPWALNSDNYGEDADNVYDWIGNSFEPFMYEGLLMDMVNGRQIGADYIKGYSVMRSIIDYSQAAPEPYKSQYKSMVKYWAENDRAENNFYNYSSPHYIKMLDDILNDETIMTRGPLEDFYVAAGMDRIAYRNAEYALGIAMASNRVVNGEIINKESLKSWNYGSAAAFLYNKEDDKYPRDYWVTVDAFRIPGTTAINNDKFGRNKQSNPYAGGVKLGDGTNYGTAGMIVDFWGSKLSAKKSYFMFDNEIVALGSDIDVSSPSGNVETILDNYKVKSDSSNVLTVDGNEVLSVDGNEASTVSVPNNSSVTLAYETIPNVTWLNYEGNVADSGIGYYFPTPTSVKVKKDVRSYSYYEINQNTDDHSQRRGNFLTLWLNHGSNPDKEDYTYVMLPGMENAEIESYSKDADVEIVAQTEQVHAVREKGLGVFAANFFTDNTVTAGPVTVNKKSSVIMKEEDGVLTVSVSDPTQKNNGLITVTIDKVAGGTLSKDNEITVDENADVIRFTVDTNHSLGKSFSVKFDTNDDSLRNITINGEDLKGFDSQILEYNVELPYGTTTVPSVVGIANDTGKNVSVTPADGLPGTTTIQVENGLTYTIHFTVKNTPSDDNTLKKILVSGNSVQSFDSQITDYTISLPYTTTSVPTIDCVPNDETASYVIQNASNLSEATTIIVTAQNGSTKVYTITFHVLDAPVKVVDNDFEDGIVNDFPYGFLENNHVANIEAKIAVDPEESNNKVLHVYDNYPTSGSNNDYDEPENQLLLNKNFQLQTTGTVTFNLDLYKPNFADNDFNGVYIQDHEGNNVVSYLFRNSGELRINIDGTEERLSNIIPHEQWINLKTIANLDSGEYTCYVNDEKVWEHVVNSGYNLNNIGFRSSAKRHTEFYVDNLEVEASNGTNIVVRDLVLNTEVCDLNLGDTYQLEATVLPEDASNKSLVFESLDEGVVTVDANGLLTAVGNGTTKVKVLSVDKSRMALCQVNVNGDMPVILYDDFEEEIINELPEGFTENNHVDGIEAKVVLDPSDNGNKVLHLYDNYPTSGSNNAYNVPENQLVVTRGFEVQNSGTVTISCDLYKPNFADNDFNGILIRGQQNNAVSEVVSYLFRNSGELRIKVDGKEKRLYNTIPHEQWINIKTIVDLDTGLYSCYINDEKVWEETTSNSYELINIGFRTSSKRHTEFYVDNLEVK